MVAALGMLDELRSDLATLGIDPPELVAEFMVLFQELPQTIGFEAGAARRLVNRLAGGRARASASSQSVGIECTAALAVTTASSSQPWPRPSAAT